MGRYRLYAALLLLGFGLIGWCGGMAAQGMGNGSPYPPPSSSTAERPVIASGQPVNNTASAPRVRVRSRAMGGILLRDSWGSKARATMGAPDIQGLAGCRYLNG